jgi:hypothetical protein
VPILCPRRTDTSQLRPTPHTLRASVDFCIAMSMCNFKPDPVRADCGKSTGDGSAKPPSPVQIRAAPPNFRFKFDGLCFSSTIRRLAIGLRWTTNLRAPRGRIPANHCVRTLSPFASWKREEVWRTSRPFAHRHVRFVLVSSRRRVPFGRGDSSHPPRAKRAASHPAQVKSEGGRNHFSGVVTDER